MHMNLIIILQKLIFKVNHRRILYPFDDPDEEGTGYSGAAEALRSGDMIRLWHETSKSYIGCQTRPSYTTTKNHLVAALPQVKRT